ncbi:MAG: hypothetical protein WCN98_06800, partial [Verrucomicrobiaceae bacterium]
HHEDDTVVAPGMLQNPSVRNWLGGIVPAWTACRVEVILKYSKTILCLPNFRMPSGRCIDGKELGR